MTLRPVIAHQIRSRFRVYSLENTRLFGYNPFIKSLTLAPNSAIESVIQFGARP